MGVCSGLGGGAREEVLDSGADTELRGEVEAGRARRLVQVELETGTPMPVAMAAES